MSEREGASYGFGNFGAPTSNHDGAGYFWEATKDTVAEGLNAVVLFSQPTSLRHLHVLQTASSSSLIAAAPSSGVSRNKKYRDDQTQPITQTAMDSDHGRNEVGNEYRPDYLAGQNDPCPKPRGLRVRPILWVYMKILFYDSAINRCGQKSSQTKPNLTNLICFNTKKV